MEHTTVLVTSDGKRVLPEDDEFFVTLRGLAPGHDPADFAVRNLGFIKFQVLERRVTIIEFDMRRVVRGALIAAERRIGESRGRLFMIRRLDSGARPVIAASAEDAIARLRELRGPAAGEPAPAPRFRAQPLDYTRLLGDPGSKLGLLGRKWCSSFGEYDDSVIAYAGEHGVLPLMIVVGVDPRRRRSVFRYIGEGHTWLTRHYAKLPLGEEIETQPDAEYGAWAAQFYQAVARSGEPRRDMVSAAMRDPDGTPYRVRYERVLMPWKTASDETMVTVVSSLVRRDPPPSS